MKRIRLRGARGRSCEAAAIRRGRRHLEQRRERALTTAPAM